MNNNKLVTFIATIVLRFYLTKPPKQFLILLLNDNRVAFLFE